jgi:hypothetical protein
MTHFIEVVLNAIADDYENVESILRSIQALSDVRAEAGHVGEALRELVTDGLAQSYELSAFPPHAKLVDFDASRIDKLWFYVTPEGKRFVQSRNQGPLN